MRHRTLLVAVSALALATAGCGGGTASGRTQLADDATFSAAIPADPGKLDPGTAVLSVTNTTLSFAYDTLVYQDPSGKVISGLADSWTTTPTSVTFTLHKGVTCSDGSPLTASQVAQNFTWVTDPKNKSPLLGVFIPADTKATADDAAGTVTVTTDKPYGFLLVSTASVWIACGKGLADRSVLATGTSGTGPYKLTEAVPSDHYTFTVRPGYAWGPGGATTKAKGIPAKVVLKVVQSESTSANLIISGSLNAAILTGPDRQRFGKVPGVTQQTLPAGIGQLFINHGPGHPGSDPAVRTALSRGVNLAELAKVASANTGTKPTGLVSLDPKPCSGDSVTGELPAYDVAVAKSMLDGAGWVPGPDGIRVKNGQKLTVRLLYATSRGEALKAAMEYLAGEWRKLGVDVQLQGSVDTQLQQSLFATGDWDAGWVPIGVTLPSQLVSFLSGPTPPNGTNFAHLDNADYTRLVGQAMGTPGEPGCKLWADAEAALVKAGDVVPVVVLTSSLTLRGVQLHIVAGNFQPTNIRMLKG